MIAMHKQENKDVEKVVVYFDGFYSLSFCLQHTENSRLMLAQFVTAIKMLWQELGLTFRNFAPICFKRSSRLSDKLWSEYLFGEIGVPLWKKCI